MFRSMGGFGGDVPMRPSQSSHLGQSEDVATVPDELQKIDRTLNGIVKECDHFRVSTSGFKDVVDQLKTAYLTWDKQPLAARENVVSELTAQLKIIAESVEKDKERSNLSSDIKKFIKDELEPLQDRLRRAQGYKQ